MCDMGMVLSLARDGCNVNEYEEEDENCYSFVEVEENDCEMCDFGYVFDKEGKCIECSTNKLSDGCLTCNPTNHEECLICNFGYY